MRRAAALVGAWLMLGAFDEPVTLAYDPGASLEDRVASPSPATTPPEPGEQYPATRTDEALPGPATPPQARDRRSAQWRATVDASVVADSNITNATDMETVELDLGDQVIPVPLDPRYRERSGIGIGVSASLNGRVPVASGVALALDAEGYLLEYEGGATDDASLLLAVGAELSNEGGRIVRIQLIGFERHYGGFTAMRGFGLRGRIVQPVGPGQRVSLLVDARSFQSDYGDDFEGSEGGAYLTYDAALRPDLSAAIGVYARGSWLGADAYSSQDFGVYGGLNHYLSDTLAGGVSAGLSRVTFDGPIVQLSPDARRDWRWYGSAYLTTRRPLLIGLTPSLTYSYNRTGSSIEFYRADRHRLRFGLSRSF
jgi:hypothetical protein